MEANSKHYMQHQAIVGPPAACVPPNLTKGWLLESDTRCYQEQKGKAEHALFIVSPQSMLENSIGPNKASECKIGKEIAQDQIPRDEPRIAMRGPYIECTE